jgi:hypothetical protein
MFRFFPGDPSARNRRNVEIRDGHSMLMALFAAMRA